MKKVLSILVFVCLLFNATAQNVGIGTTTPHANAILDISSTNKGLLLPRVADTNAISGAKPAGLTIYSNSDNKLYFYNGTKWQASGVATGGDSLWYLKNDSVLTTNKKYISNATSIVASPAANTQLAGSLLIQGDYFVATQSTPTVAQTISMVNGSGVIGTNADSINRVFDPGGPGSNYISNLQATASIPLFIPSNITGVKIRFNPADFGLAAGDTLWFGGYDFPACRTNNDRFFTNTTTAPSEFYLNNPINSSVMYIVFKSDNSVNDRGFDITVTKVYDTSPSVLSPISIPAMGSHLYYNPMVGAFRVGLRTSEKAGIYSAAFGASNASKTFGIAAGSSTSEGFAATAMGASTATGDNSVALGSSNATKQWATATGSSVASGLYATAVGQSNAKGDYSFSAGALTFANGAHSAVVGRFNDTLVSVNDNTPQTPLFTVGNGAAFNTPSNAFVVLRNGNTGIGNVNPIVPLHIKSANLGEAVRVDGPSSALAMFDNGNNRGYIQAIADGLALSSYAGQHLRLFSNQGSNERFTILSNGNVGINNNNPQANVHISSAGVEALRVEGPNAAQTFYNSNGYIGYLQAFNNTMSLAANGVNNRLGLYTNFSERLAILSNGNIGIGNATPAYKLDVAGDVNFTGALRANASSGTAGQVLTSNGASAPTWVNPTNSVYNTAVRKTLGAAILNIPADNNYVEIADLTHTFNVTENNLVNISAVLQAYSGTCVICPDSETQVALELDGVIVIANRKRIRGGNIYDQFALEYLTAITPGSHTVKVKAKVVSGTAVTIAGSFWEVGLTNPTILNLMFFKQ
jgi:hypothetical protein